MFHWTHWSDFWPDAVERPRPQLMRSPQPQLGQSDLNPNKASSKFMFAMNAIKDYHQISAIAKMLNANLSALD